ncbi:MAG: hypothetical protein JWM36_3232 [Hyphomicrobiales bacterium]|nr:hypothetical protein [Hyphomicrobiales bacterium]
MACDGEHEPSLGSQNVDIDGVAVTLENGRQVILPNRTFDQGLWAEGGSSFDGELGDNEDHEHDGREPDSDMCDPIERDEREQIPAHTRQWMTLSDIVGMRAAGDSVERLRVILLKLRGRADQPGPLFAVS